MTEKFRIVCPECGSDDITKDACARWSNETQDWELSSTYDCSTCGDCGNEGDDGFDRLPIGDRLTMETPPERIIVRLYSGTGPDLKVNAPGEGLGDDTTLAEFFEANDDRFDEEEMHAYREALVAKGTFYGGGATAVVEWRIWVVGVEEAAANP